MWGDQEPPKDNWQAVCKPLDVGEPSTAIDIGPGIIKGLRYLVAVGTESGRIALYSWAMRPMADWNMLLTLDQSYPTIYLKPAKCTCLSSFLGPFLAGNRSVLSLV